MAEARCAVEEPRISHVISEEEQKRDIFQEWKRSLARRFYRTRNLIYNGLWPTSLYNLAVVVLLLSCCMIWDWEFCKGLTSRLWGLADTLSIPVGFPVVIRAFLTSCVAGFLFFVALLYMRRFMLRTLLSYSGWIYEQPKTQSATTILWGLAVRCVFGYHPLLYSCQQSLPRMGVPSLGQTLDTLILSLKPLYGEDTEKWEKMTKDRQDFEKNLGPKLQRVLVLKSWWAQNYVSDWWEKYVYLKSRSTLLINSNYYIMDQSYWIGSKIQVARTANLMHQFLTFKQLIDHERLEPLVIRNTIPICMAQYEKVFSTTRIPGEDCDSWLHCDSTESKHVAVLRKGLIYKVSVFDKKGKLLTPVQLEKQLDWIIKDADVQTSTISESEKSIPALTGIDRTSWYKIRTQYFSEGINKESLDTVEKSILFVSLQDCSYEDLTERGKHLLGGTGTSVWFDKSINIITFPNGRFGLNCEHSYADAPVIGHLSEFNMTNEISDDPYLPDGHCKPQPGDETFQERTMPTQLLWDIEESLASVIKGAVGTVTKAIDDLDLCVKDHDSYGKGFMKTCKVSPDAYIQMALQITYFKNAGKFALTYESSMTRFYLNGRTETVRSLTCESASFVRAFRDPTVDREEKLKLFRKACTVHQKMYRDAMTGQASDRHLFALYVVSKGLGYECDFLKNALTLPWTLSTSQQPQQQIARSPDCNLPQYKDMLCPGGGFGPVSDDGYGVSYMIPGDKKVFFHVSAKNSTPGTSASKFMDQLFETLQEMREMFSDKNGTS
ncbi:carnitine O-palmitoyltransferase 1, liver isoform-like [Ylistrum balloti]|uniref:carnitine O-palmitoyltransferase 1, liver isoform-like n=1 Tax=Ylistrum balloti TaxID=509963 RepID=UPI002905CC17|nr:carnitine O-palmitoyltransferase 1, liver isoform-like [Ylistrum balloti]